MTRFRFSPARESGDVICGAQRPGYPHKVVGKDRFLALIPGPTSSPSQS
jgi:hypothetical protein